ncbi:hypothetical protein LTR91_024825 [Friedmanniomyces endolithicus]|uniref:Mob1/phocein n=1 Tax=Friedmanniomyces endolithicus TaxID=329885 RepID=A0AAN6H0F0_9PEZI|nr:hypothetical protein LTR59_008300 [Friedmanniomyces endolithicus]KAK0800353.1 hypothetical protein LTR38_007191 [Friedmanniomyces endolithicus]KAK0844600.1 hypothetical protein LTR03_007930 [Friedmanniomyces endolithicus]KAK0878857.1 hypothetical protein LTR87_007307 [Friedmanniomyces endolithicus]KAK0891196.1 hypothetical protein LTR57_024870 [Friedmanniomyces endolithicus]
MEPTEPSDPAEPSKPMETAESSKPTEATESTAPTEPTQSTKPKDPKASSDTKEPSIQTEPKDPKEPSTAELPKGDGTMATEQWDPSAMMKHEEPMPSSPSLPLPLRRSASAELRTERLNAEFRKLKTEANDKKSTSRAFAQRPTGNNQPRNQNQVPSRVNTSSPSGYSSSSLGQPSVAAAPPSPSLATSMPTNDQARNNNQNMNRVPLFFREEHAGFIVKGNFMTLAAKPHLIEQGEWMAHQIVEQNRLLSGMIKCTQGEDRSSGRSVCSETGCPTMSAGPTTYTWIDTNRNPINLPAPTYIKHIQTWVTGKIQDYAIFPTDTFSSAPPLPSPAQLQADPNNWLGKTSGFPQRFETECKNMYKQMFRCYAHLYWQHWLFFWDTSCHRELNTCFMHFASVGIIYGLLSEKDAEPMQPLIDLWVKQGVMPKIEKAEAANGVMTPTSAGGAGSVGGPGSGGASGSPGIAGSSGSAGGAGLENGNGGAGTPTGVTGGGI